MKQVLTSPFLVLLYLLLFQPIDSALSWVQVPAVFALPPPVVAPLIALLQTALRLEPLAFLVIVVYVAPLPVLLEVVPVVLCDIPFEI